LGGEHNITRWVRVANFYNASAVAEDSGQFLARRRNAVLLIDEKFLAFRTLNSQPTETLKYIYWCDDKILRKGVHRVHLTKKNMYTRYHVIIQLFSFVIFSVNYFSKINC